MDACACVLAVLLSAAHGFSLQGPSGPLVAQLGGSVLLPCAAESPLPLEELEVEWRRADSGALLHLFQEGEERPESQDQAYRGRAHFFPEKIARGDYSLLLENITVSDRTLFRCVVYTTLDSGETTCEIQVEFLMVHGFVHTVFGHVGWEVVLDCFVESHVPPEELEEVKWKRTDQDILVLLYQDGMVHSDSSHERYLGRTEFFTTEISKGNFSLRLGSLRTEDKGEYVCEAHHGLRSGNTTVELPSLSLSAVHHVIWVLCITAFGLSIASLVHFIQTNKESDSKAMQVHISLVIVPNILLCVAFILWGVCSEGFTDEAALCATVSLTRVVCCFWISPHLHKFPNSLQRAIKLLGIMVQYSAIAIVFYSVALINRKKISFLGETVIPKREFGVYSGVIPTMCVCGFIAVSIRAKWPFLYCIEEKEEKRPHGIFSFLFMELCNLSQVLFVSIKTRSFDPAERIALFATLVLEPLFLIIIRNVRKRLCYGNMPWTITMVVLVPLYLASYLWCLYQIQDHVEKYFPYERDGVMAVTALLKVLTAMALLEHPGDCQGSVNGSTPHLIVYGFGATVLNAVNAIALTGELILKARNGRRWTPDLRLVTLPCECIFVGGCFFLLVFNYWKCHRRREGPTDRHQRNEGRHEHQEEHQLNAVVE
ncbi:uncharacterized protein LOC134444927 [Engraulis encrasicolus]|uniref:uncharacterized protein LOC134444927 n=1 Tax=Engraulis encrasicolus TaxID=184585 RepID=UPI002FD2C976